MMVGSRSSKTFRRSASGMMGAASAYLPIRARARFGCRLVWASHTSLPMKSQPIRTAVFQQVSGSIPPGSGRPRETARNDLGSELNPPYASPVRSATPQPGRLTSSPAATAADTGEPSCPESAALTVR